MSVEPLSKFLTQAAAEIEAQMPTYGDRVDDLNSLVEHIRFVADRMRELETAAM